MIKLLRSIYHIADEENMKIDIGKRLVLRILDEDTGVKVSPRIPRDRVIFR